MIRRNSGTLIRDAMNQAGLDIKGLAARTREIDPDGRGISKTLVGYAVAQGKTGRDDFSPRASSLISDALNKPLEHLFDHDPASDMPIEYASTCACGTESQMLSPPSVEPLLSNRELAKSLKKSLSWIYRQLREYPRGHPHPFPYHPVGKGKRFRLSDVLAWCEEIHADATKTAA